MGGQYHHELMKYCPPSYVLCVSSHFWPFNIVKFVLEKLDKNLGSADPPPQLGRNPKFFQKLDLKAPLIRQCHVTKSKTKIRKHNVVLKKLSSSTLNRNIHNAKFISPGSTSEMTRSAHGHGILRFPGGVSIK